MKRKITIYVIAGSIILTGFLIWNNRSTTIPRLDIPQTGTETNITDLEIRIASQKMKELRQGEIYEISKYRKNFVKAGDREVINVDIALEKAQRGEASFTLDESVEHARLTDAALTYWEDSSDINTQSYLQPVWVFQGEIPAGSAKNTRFEAIVPALK